jgi:hypothetical protein
MNMCNKYEATVLWSDIEFKRALVEIEREIFRNASIKRASEPSDDMYLVQAMRKM